MSRVQFYSEGILDIVYCSSTNLSHTVLVIGYGTYKNKDFWLIKNRFVLYKYMKCISALIIFIFLLINDGACTSVSVHAHAYMSICGQYHVIHVNSYRGPI